jgi:L,D-transpeptidase ErfK/SrfK
MSRQTVWTILVAVALLGLLVLVVPTERTIPPGVWSSIPYDSLAVRLPADARAAHKELERVRRAMAKLRPRAPYIVIDTHANTLSLRTADTVLLVADCSTGTGGELVDSLTGRHWVFDTPRGAFTVTSKLVEPWWRKPDWAFIEEGESVPRSENDRMDSEMLGKYAIGFGDGYFIHGTIYQRLLGISVTHGCVRLGDESLKKLYERVRIGTRIYIF